MKELILPAGCHPGCSAQKRVEELERVLERYKLAFDSACGYFETCVPDADCGFQPNETGDDCGGDFDKCNKAYLLYEAETSLSQATKQLEEQQP